MDDENNSKNKYLEIYKNKNFWTKLEIILAVASLTVGIISIPWLPQSWFNFFVSNENNREHKQSASVVDEKLEITESNSNSENSIIWYENGNSIDGLKDCNYDSKGVSKVSNFQASHNDSIAMELDFANKSRYTSTIGICSSMEVVDPKSKKFLILSISGGGENSENISIELLEYVSSVGRKWNPVVRFFKTDYLDPYIYPDVKFKSNKWYLIKIPLEKFKLPESGIYGLSLSVSEPNKLYINKIAFE